MLTAASVCVEYRHTAPLWEEFVKSFFPKGCVVHSLSDVDAQEQNKMLADSAEGARREVPQLMQVCTSEICSCQRMGMKMIRVRSADCCGSGKGELVIMMWKEWLS